VEWLEFEWNEASETREREEEKKDEDEERESVLQVEYDDDEAAFRVVVGDA